MTISKAQVAEAAGIHAKLVAGADKRRQQHKARFALGLALVALTIGAAIAVVGLPKADR